ncbi:MAG: hypothetical protein JST82_13975 [Bacteroidetes bacterium]|nr:hypothetical protein [Bacteroidota bacterium]
MPTFIEKNCAYCSKIVKAGWADKRFCNTVCRSAHHNNSNQEIKKELYRNAAVIKKNELLLRDFFEINKTKDVDRRTVLDLGIDAKYYSKRIFSAHKKLEIIQMVQMCIVIIEDNNFQILPYESACNL